MSETDTQLERTLTLKAVVLFGLASIQFARHPEGLVEYGKRRATRRFNERFDQRERERAPQETSP